jgi:hypothetical protein
MSRYERFGKDAIVGAIFSVLGGLAGSLALIGIYCLIHGEMPNDFLFPALKYGAVPELLIAVLVPVVRAFKGPIRNLRFWAVSFFLLSAALVPAALIAILAAMIAMDF